MSVIIRVLEFRIVTLLDTQLVSALSMTVDCSILGRLFVCVCVNGFHIFVDRLHRFLHKGKNQDSLSIYHSFEC